MTQTQTPLRTRVAHRAPLALIAGLTLMAAVGIAQAQHDEHFRSPQVHAGPHEHFDARFHHDHVYPEHGRVVTVLPEGRHYEVYHGHDHYYFAGGVWYAPRGASFVVVAPPIGVYVPFLPPFYTTVWVGGAPFYYANDTYYEYAGPNQGYEVVQPPSDASVSTQAPAGAPYPPEQAPAAAGYPANQNYQSPPPGYPSQPPAGYQSPPPPAGAGAAAAAGAALGDNLFIYPKNGQSADQQSRDRYECHSWASAQTGFDPSAPGGGAGAARRDDYYRAISACLDARGYTVR